MSTSFIMCLWTNQMKLLFIERDDDGDDDDANKPIVQIKVELVGMWDEVELYLYSFWAPALFHLVRIFVHS